VNCPSCATPLVETARFCPACGKQTLGGATVGALTRPPSDIIGREIAGRYKIVAKLGEGGMGAVYRGEQLSLKRAVAVKLLRPELSADPMLLRRFNAEAEAVAKLGHPNTVNIYDFGQDSDGALFIAMEFIEGRSLRSAIAKEGPFSARRALTIASQIAASLSDAHARSIVHRDLKPDNVMLQDRGRQRDIVRVLDFGIAKLRDDSRATQQAMTQAGDMLGTPQYMAPEQIRGTAVDGRADIYALGCIIYEMVTGAMPYEAPTVMAMLSKHLLEQAVAPSTRRPDLTLPPAIDQLVMSAMAKEPSARPATMDAYAEHIAAMLDMLPADPNRSAGMTPMSAQQAAAPPAPTPSPYHSPPPGPPSSVPAGVAAVPSYVPMAAPVPPPPRPHKVPWLALVLVALVGGGIAVWLATRSHAPAAAPPSEPSEPSEPQTPPAKDPWQKSGDRDRAPWSGADAPAHRAQSS
jgi:serine/threonine protein kinase